MRFDWKRAGLGAAIVVLAGAALHLTHGAGPRLVHWMLVIAVVVIIFGSGGSGGSGGPSGPPGVQA